MGKVCQVCAHPDRQTIEQALLQGVRPSDLARVHHVSVNSVRRHKDMHLLHRSEKHRGPGFGMMGARSISVTSRVVRKTSSGQDAKEC